MLARRALGRSARSGVRSGNWASCASMCACGRARSRECVWPRARSQIGARGSKRHGVARLTRGCANEMLAEPGKCARWMRARVVARCVARAVARDLARAVARDLARAVARDLARAGAGRGGFREVSLHASLELTGAGRELRVMNRRASGGRCMKGCEFGSLRAISNAP